MKEKFIQVRTSKDFKDRLAKVSKALKIPRSEIIREATDEKINELAKLNPAVKAALARVA